MDCPAAAGAVSGGMHMQNVERQLRALIREHHRLMSTVEQLSPSAAEAKLAAANRIQQEIINLAYELRQFQTFKPCRAGINAPIHINATGTVLPKPFAQMNFAQTSTTPERPVLNGSSAVSNNNKMESNASFDLASVKPAKKVSLPVVAQNLVFHNPAGSAPGLKLGAPPSAVFIIKVPPHQTGPLNIVTLQQNGITNGANIAAPVNGLQMNGVVMKAVAPFNRNSTAPKLIQIDDSKTTSTPSPLITHKLAVQATKNIESRIQKLPEKQITLPPPPPPLALEFEETEESKVTQGLKQQTWFLSNLGLCTPDRHRELSERRTERRRRKTANPHFSSAAVEERRRQENERKKKRTIVSNGKNKVELKEELKQQAEKLRKERAELLRKHGEARQRLTEERLRAQMLIDQQRTVERMLERLRKFMSIVAENRPPLCT